MSKFHFQRWFENPENPDCYEPVDDRPETHECNYCGLEAKYECDLIAGDPNEFDSAFGVHVCEDCYEIVRKECYVERQEEL